MKDYLSGQEIELEIDRMQKNRSREILEELRREDERRKTYIELKEKLLNSFTKEQRELYSEIKIAYSEYIVGNRIHLF